jgi:hypothetical protein
MGWNLRFGSKVMSALPPIATAKAKAGMCGATGDVRYRPIADMTPLYSIGVLVSGPVITNTFAVTLGNLIYQFGETATKLNIENLVDALSAHAFVMHQYIKLALQ